MANAGGTIIGSTKAALGQRPGEKVIQYYHGNVQHGFYLTTYLSRVQTYWGNDRTSTQAGTNSAYSVGVYRVEHQSLDYTTLYMTVYSVSGGELGMGGADVSLFIVGER